MNDTRIALYALDVKAEASAARVSTRTGTSPSSARDENNTEFMSTTR
jgi:hypothetical protein